MSTPNEILQNCKKPEGSLGEETIRRMNESHAGLTAWGLSKVEVSKNAAVLDIGCGGGKALRKLSECAAYGKLYGVDYSETSVVMARQENQEDVASGKMKIVLGSVSNLPFQDELFDVVTSVESYYFWPNLLRDFTEVRRVMKKGAVFAIIAEMYNHEGQSEEDKRIVKVLEMHNNTPEELKGMLLDAGFQSVDIELEHNNGWLCTIARK